MLYTMRSACKPTKVKAVSKQQKTIKRIMLTMKKLFLTCETRGQGLGIGAPQSVKAVTRPVSTAKDSGRCHGPHTGPSTKTSR